MWRRIMLWISVSMTRKRIRCVVGLVSNVVGVVLCAGHRSLGRCDGKQSDAGIRMGQAR